MARTRTKKSLEVQLQELEQKMKKHEEAIKALEEERTRLLQAKREMEMKELYEYLQENQISISEALSVLQGRDSSRLKE